MAGKKDIEILEGEQHSGMSLTTVRRTLVAFLGENPPKKRVVSSPLHPKGQKPKRVSFIARR